MKMHEIKNITLCALFAALIATGAFIRIPLPALSITMQVLFVLLSGMMLNTKQAVTSNIVYIAAGLAGLPVFSAGGGFSYVLNPGFGYLVGFPIAAGIISTIRKRNKSCTLAGLAGLAIIYIFGISYYYIICKYVSGTPVSAKFLFVYCFLTVLPGDILSLAASVFLSGKLKKIIE